MSSNTAISGPDGKTGKGKEVSAWKNNLYALKLGYQISKRRVLFSFFKSALGNFEWVFFSGFFLRHIVDALDHGQDFNSIFLFILLCGALFFCTNLYSNYTENVVYPLEDTRIYQGVYGRLYLKAKNVELRCYEDADFYNRYTMAADHAEEKITKIIDSLWGILTAFFAVGIVFYSMFQIHPLSVLFIISPLLGNFLFGNWKNKFEFRRYKEQAVNDKVMNYVNRVMYLPDYAKEVRISNVFHLLRNQYDEATNNNVNIAKKYAFRIASANFFRLLFTFTVIFEGVLLFAIYENLVQKSISLAQLTVMTSLMVAATWILIGLFENVMETIKNGMFINNLRGFLEYEEQIPEDQDGIQPGEFESITFEHVSFSYQEEQTIKDLSFTVKRGEKVALVGHNGAGKTTIIKLLLRLYDPTEGVIRLNGVDIREYNLRAYRDLFAAAFQDYRIFGMTVKENVLMGRHLGADGQTVINANEISVQKEDLCVKEALQKAGVLDKIATLPHGIHTMMTKEFAEDGAVLSGGEGQKVAVARAFIKPSPVRIFDEPSSALDPIAEYELFNSIMADGENHTMIFISHRLSSVKNSDRVYMLEQGRKIEEGTHKELLRQDGSYARMYRKQAMNYLAVDSVEGVAL